MSWLPRSPHPAWGLLLACQLFTFGFLSAPARAQNAQQTSRPEDLPEEESDESSGGPTTRVLCLDDVDDAGNTRKGVQPKDFNKRMRLELSAIGGFIASDVLSSSYTYGGAATFFPSEDLGLELLVTRSQMSFRLEEAYTGFDGAQRFVPGAALQAMGALVLSPFHAKFKFTERSIVHGDLFLLVGGGRTFHDTVQGLSGQVGAGLQLYLARFVSFRFDVRDFILPQEVLGRGRVTHNIATFAGLGVWTP